ncbi:hypothetical protein [Janthinobacterium sp. RB2P8]|uniref:hypothetical protein n=1 Tax=Janthinobacterium sp. RB2P8 TaxID=3424191 RepID=UPI003F250DDF
MAALGRWVHCWQAPDCANGCSAGKIRAPVNLYWHLLWLNVPLLYIDNHFLARLPARRSGLPEYQASMFMHFPRVFPAYSSFNLNVVP